MPGFETPTLFDTPPEIGWKQTWDPLNTSDIAKMLVQRVQQWSFLVPKVPDLSKGQVLYSDQLLLLRFGRSLVLLQPPLYQNPPNKRQKCDQTEVSPCAIV